MPLVKLKTNSSSLTGIDTLSGGRVKDDNVHPSTNHHHHSRPRVINAQCICTYMRTHIRTLTNESRLLIYRRVKVIKLTRINIPIELLHLFASDVKEQAVIHTHMHVCENEQNGRLHDTVMLTLAYAQTYVHMQSCQCTWRKFVFMLPVFIANCCLILSGRKHNYRNDMRLTI